MEAVDVGAALSDVAGRAGALAEAARDRGVASADLQTTASGVQPRYGREAATVAGYTAYQSLRVTVRDPALVGDLVEAFAGVAGNALTVDRIALDIADPEPVLERAREAAFADARRKAEQYAVLAGRALGKVVWVSDVVHSGVQPRYDLMSAKAGGLPVELGENSVTSTVTVRWEWI